MSMSKAMTIFSNLMEFMWCTRTTSQHLRRGRVLLEMDPNMKTFTITMPSVGVFIFGTALCCFCCFKYGLQRWYDRALTKTRTKSRISITYAASLRYKKDQLEQALKKVSKLRQAEPTRSDLKYEAVALKEGLRMINEHLRNSDRYKDYCEGLKRSSTDALTSKRVSFEIRESSFLNPIFSAQQAIDSGYMIDPVKKTESQDSGTRSPVSSDEECHNPKHKELELYLMSTRGTIRQSLLRFPDSVTTSPTVAGFPPSSAPTSRVTSPLGRREVDAQGRSPSISPFQPGLPPESAMLPQNMQTIPNRLQNPMQPPSGMPQTWQPGPSVMPNLGSTSSGGPNVVPGPTQVSSNTYGGSQPRASP